jgi:ribonucleotide reductase alpha subunit
MNKLENINVRKRNGKLESFDIEKISQILNWATAGIKDVSASDIVLKATFNIDDKVNTKQLHQLLIDASLNCFTPDTPNYQWVASRLLNFALRKEVWGGVNPPKLNDFLASVVKDKVYDPVILTDYTVEEINKLDDYLNHERDFYFSYAGIRQLCDKYLVQNRKTKKIFETPQFAYMAIAMTIFRSYPKDIRMQYVKKAYDAFSKLKINLPTPQLAGIRTPLRAYSSCCLIDVGDSMDSILASLSAVGKATSQRYGIGINFGRIRSINSEIRKGEVLHTGKIPFLKTFEAMTKSCQQNGIRGGGATVNIPFWDYEIEDVVVLKNNGGTEDNRVRKLDYVIQFSKLFWQRVQKDEWITLFSADQVRDLYDAFGYPEFDDLYLKYEGDVMLAPMRKKIKARELASLFVKERTETGRIYALNVDHVQAHGAWDIKAEMTNLCVSANTRMATNFGLVKAIDLYNLHQPLIATVDNRTLTGEKGVTQRVTTPMYCTANLAPVYEVQTDKGYKIKATLNHDFFVIDVKRTEKGSQFLYNKKKLSDLKPGDRLMIQSGKGQFGLKGDYDLGLVAGFIAGDGTFGKNRRGQYSSAHLDLHNTELPLFDEVFQSFSKVSGNTAIKPEVKKVTNTHSKVRMHSTSVFNAFREEGFGKDLKVEVPEAIFQGTEECVRGYLRGLFTADGTVVKNEGKPHLQLTSIQKSLLEDVQLLLANFGIISGIYSLPVRKEAHLPYVTKDAQIHSYISKPTYRLDITGRYAAIFKEEVGFLGEKQAKLEKLCSEIKSSRKDCFVKVKEINFAGYEDVFDVTQEDKNSVIFNGLVTGQCVEIVHPTKPLRFLEDPEGEIGVCVLAATNMLEIQDEKDHENVCDIIVRILDEVIDHQDYFCPAAENFTKNRRSLGIGYTNMAAWLAKNGYKYTDVETPNFVAGFAEQQQYYLLKASMNLAKEKGPCNKFGDTKYSKGILPIDTYKKDIDAFVTAPLSMDWESLRKDILEYGLRHSTLSAIMPCESSSVVQNATNGIEPPRDAMSYKKSKAGSVPMLVPGWNKWKKHYQMAYDIKDNKSILNVVAGLVKFLDMSVSTNVYYKYTDYPDGKLPDIDVLKDIMYAYKVGIPALYYSNTNDESDQNDQQEDCAGGACSI